MNLSDLKKRMVDLRRSEYDKERSSPKDGKYLWTKKVYLKLEDYRDDNSRPEYKYRWVAYDDKNDFAQFNHWRMNYEATPVDYKDPGTEIYPEPLVPNVEGHYRYMDMILMKIPIKVEVDRIVDNRNRYDKAREGLDNKFKSEVRAVDENAVTETVKL
ncbi:MAG: hypothetical protein M0R06_09785 [Sphaerochaeta sp.]|nr:hypothetical protein [Sphaerochaeta sp.]